MIYNIYSIFDSAVGAYLPPMFMRSHGEAIRTFETAVRDESHAFHRNASDYSLYHHGTLNDLDASFDIFVEPIVLAKAHEVLARS